MAEWFIGGWSRLRRSTIIHHRHFMFHYLCRQVKNEILGSKSLMAHCWLQLLSDPFDLANHSHGGISMS